MRIVTSGLFRAGGLVRGCNNISQGFTFLLTMSTLDAEAYHTSHVTSSTHGWVGNTRLSSLASATQPLRPWRMAGLYAPVQIVVTEQRKAFYHFITTLCAIVGGVFTVAGIVDGLLHQSVNLAKKVRRGDADIAVAGDIGPDCESCCVRKC